MYMRFSCFIRVFCQRFMHITRSTAISNTVVLYYLNTYIEIEPTELLVAFVIDLTVLRSFNIHEYQSQGALYCQWSDFTWPKRECALRIGRAQKLKGVLRQLYLLNILTRTSNFYEKYLKFERHVYVKFYVRLRHLVKIDITDQ